jgi:hypothetical protein
MHHTQRSVLDVCNALKELVEEGAVEIAPEAPVEVMREAPVEVVREAPVEVEREAQVEVVREAPLEMACEVPAEDAEPVDEWPTQPMPDPFADVDDDITEIAEVNQPYEPNGVNEQNHVDEGVGVRTDERTAIEGVLEEGDARDRGALLRLFSALRDQ